ncbi:M20 family metallopeptidase [Lentibacillus salicampi]|uniref:M20 family peptidase n=1 Tax=Lentibacillus salicampi TaxID=175306 RepID=A0A4Y9A8I4_9BACI|nr:M20 family metallopeptidase [Lentibacillus salicampi]TFJ92093.1 M20 family peptidase [Lentibacillus salicampi]
MIEINIDNIIEDTLKLVQAKSVTGNTVQVADSYEKMLKEVGCTVTRYEFIKNNPTLVAHFGKAKEGEKKLIFNGHMDVVPLEQSGAYVEDERIYGRGACDMKGSLAAILEVARSIHTSKAEVSGEVIIIANSLHESPDGRGEDLTELVEKAEDLMADAAVVMEGATYDCTVAQIGSATFNLTIEREGNPSHQLYTPEGTPHPISVMSDVIRSLDKKNKELNDIYIEDIGYGSYFIGNATSGELYNQMPKTATLEGVRRYGPEQTFEDVEAEIKSLMDKVAQKCGVDIHVDMRKVRDGYRVDRNADILDVLASSLKKIRGLDAPFVGKKLVTDAGIIANGLNIPVVSSGPDQQQAHADDEFVEISELHLTAKIYIDLIQTYVGLKE